MEQINHSILKDLDEKYGSPFYIMNPEMYKKNINAFLDAFRRKYEKIIAGYSFKTNYVPALCNLAKEEGCVAEVVSDMEYALAEAIGFKNIIFNGPIKRSSILFQALEKGSLVNLDSEYEVDLVCQYKKRHPNANVGVGIRININLTDEYGRSPIQCGIRFGRFGFPATIIGKNIERLRESGVRIIGLHGHTSTSDRAVLNYQIITQQMLAVCEVFRLNDLEYFDIGGGFFGAAPEGMDLTGRPTYEDYANCILGEVMNNEWFLTRKPYIVIEPGSSVVSNVFNYYTKVYQNKTVGTVNFVMVDGSVFDVKPTMHANNLPHSVYRATNIMETYTCDVVGSTCMEKDVMLKKVELPKLEAGDFIEFRGVGAYTISLTPTFINYLPPIIMHSQGEYVEVRRRQNIKDIIRIYKY